MLEMPTSGDLKSGDSLFFTIPIPRVSTEPPSPEKIALAPNGIGLGHMKSYMKYILSKFTLIVLMPTESLSATKYVQKCVRNRPTNKKNSHFEGKMGYISNYSTEKIKRWFYPGDLVTRTGEREICVVSGRLPDNPEELACIKCSFRKGHQRPTHVVYLHKLKRTCLHHPCMLLQDKQLLASCSS